MSPQAVVALQRAVGNTAVARMIEIQRAPEQESRKRAGSAGNSGPEPRRARLEEDEQVEGDSDEMEMEMEMVLPTPLADSSASKEQARPRRFRRKKVHRGHNDADKKVASCEPELRMLDRVARILYESLGSWDRNNNPNNRASPHFSVALTKGYLRVSGNTDRPFSEQHKQGRKNSSKKP